MILDAYKLLMAHNKSNITNGCRIRLVILGKGVLATGIAIALKKKNKGKQY